MVSATESVPVLIDTIALAEVKPQISGPRFTFTFPTGKFRSIVMRLDEVAGEGEKFEDPRLDFKGTRSVMVNKDLLVFRKGAPVSAYKLTDFNDAELLQKTPLATLPHNDYLEDFSIANMANNLIVLAGGCDKAGDPSAKTFGLIVKEGKWETKSLPDLNVAR